MSFLAQSCIPSSQVGAFSLEGYFKPFLITLCYTCSTGTLVPAGRPPRRSESSPGAFRTLRLDIRVAMVTFLPGITKRSPQVVPLSMKRYCISAVGTEGNWVLLSACSPGSRSLFIVGSSWNGGSSIPVCPHRYLSLEVLIWQLYLYIHQLCRLLPLIEYLQPGFTLILHQVLYRNVGSKG